jgi:hypothetical protein
MGMSRAFFLNPDLSVHIGMRSERLQASRCSMSIDSVHGPIYRSIGQSTGQLLRDAAQSRAVCVCVCTHTLAMHTHTLVLTHIGADLVTTHTLVLTS